MPLMKRTQTAVRAVMINKGHQCPVLAVQQFIFIQSKHMIFSVLTFVYLSFMQLNFTYNDGKLLWDGLFVLVL